MPKVKKLIITEKQVNTLKKYLIEETEEVTYYQFLSELKNFLRLLLSKPITSELPDFFKNHGFTKGKLIDYMVKTGILQRTEKVNTDIPEQAELEVSYVIPKRGFENKVKIMYIKLFEHD